MQNKLLIIQEILPSYRVPVLEGIATITEGDVTVFTDYSSADFGTTDLNKNTFKHIKANWKKLFGIFKNDWKAFELRNTHDVVLHGADFKFFTLWAFLFLNMFSNKKLYLNGQGGYKKDGIIVDIVYTVALFLCDGYICYTEYSRKALKEKVPRFLHKKITVSDNTLFIKPNEKINSSVSNTVFYIGRLREGCDIEILLEAAEIAGVHVNIIGAGDDEYLAELKSKYSHLATFFGAVFSEDKQRDIAKNCFCGAYGGDAGLSVVHYMSLGLPVIVHRDISSHMGPEPSYVLDGINGLFFERGNVNDLAKKLRLLVKDKQIRELLADGALRSFEKLRTPSMSDKFVKIMGLK